MARATPRQADRFYRSLTGLVRAYQFRDREHPGRYGISVSEWYPLELLDAEGSVAMGELARRMAIDVSTLTRIVDRLEARGSVARTRDTDDRRVLRVAVTRKGRATVLRIQRDLVAEYRRILDDVAAEHRDEVIAVLERLAAHVTDRENRRSTD